MRGRHTSACVLGALALATATATDASAHPAHAASKPQFFDNPAQLGVLTDDRGREFAGAVSWVQNATRAAFAPGSARRFRWVAMHRGDFRVKWVGQTYDPAAVRYLKRKAGVIRVRACNRAGCVERQYTFRWPS
jgi:hypothetical protein